MRKTLGRALSFCGVLACAASLAVAQSKPIPQLVKQGDKFTFMVDGKPFIMLGGQVGNFSGFPDRMESAWPAFKAMNLNTVEYPVYWNVIEPEEGQVRFQRLRPDPARLARAGAAGRDAVVRHLEERGHGLGAQLGQVRSQALSPRARFRRQAHPRALAHVEGQPGGRQESLRRP